MSLYYCVCVLILGDTRTQPQLGSFLCALLKEKNEFIDYSHAASWGQKPRKIENLDKNTCNFKLPVLMLANCCG